MRIILCPSSISDKNDNDNFIARIDHQINSVHSVAARYAFGQDSQIFPLGSLGGFGSGSRLGAFAQRSPTRVQVVSASWLSVLNANHVNEVRFGYSRFRNSFGSLDDNVNPLPRSALILGPENSACPNLILTEPSKIWARPFLVSPAAASAKPIEILDNFTWTHGRHTREIWRGISARPGGFLE